MSSRRYRSSQFISPYDLPLVDDFEEQLAMPVSTIDAEKNQEEVPPSAFFNWTQQETRLPEPYKPFSKLRDYNFDAYSHHRFEKYSMLSTMVLKSIPSQQEQGAAVTRSEISEAAGNAAIVGFGNILGYVFRAGSTFLIQRGLQVELFGLYSLSLSVVTLIGSIFVFGLDDAMVRYVAIYRSKKQTNLLRSLTIFCSALAGGAGIFGALLVFYFAPSLAQFYHKPDIVPYLRIMAPMIPLLCMQVIWVGGLQGFKEFKKRVLSQRVLIPILTGLMLLFTFIFFRRNITAFALVTLLGTLISTLFNLYYLFGSVSRVSEPGPEEYNPREWLGFALPNFLSNIVDIVLDSIDTLLLGYFAVSTVAIGQYAAAIKITGFISLPLQSLNTMFAPTIAELHSKGEKQKLEAMFKLITKWSIALSLPIFGISILFSTSLLYLLSGSSYVAAWPLIIPFAVGSMINTGTGSVGYMLLMTGHQKLSFLNSLAAIIVNIVLGVILTPRYGALGLAVSTGLASGTVNLMRLLQVRLILKIQPYSWETLKPLAAWVISALLTGSLLSLFSMSNLSIQLFDIRLSIQLSLIPVFLASYIGLLALFRISPEDKIVLERLGRKFRRKKNKARL